MSKSDFLLKMVSLAPVKGVLSQDKRIQRLQDLDDTFKLILSVTNLNTNKMISKGVLLCLFKELDRGQVQMKNKLNNLHQLFRNFNRPRKQKPKK